MASHSTSLLIGSSIAALATGVALGVVGDVSVTGNVSATSAVTGQTLSGNTLTVSKNTVSGSILCLKSDHTSGTCAAAPGATGLCTCK